jgi:hypothetical protein
MSIASKIYEEFSPEIRDWIYICNNAYNSEDVLRMEAEIIHVLGPDILRNETALQEMTDLQDDIAAMKLCDLSLHLPPSHSCSIISKACRLMIEESLSCEDGIEAFRKRVSECENNGSC